MTQHSDDGEARLARRELQLTIGVVAVPTAMTAFLFDMPPQTIPQWAGAAIALGGMWGVWAIMFCDTLSDFRRKSKSRPRFLRDG